MSRKAQYEHIIILVKFTQSLWKRLEMACYWCCDIEVEPTALRVWRRDRSTLVSVPSNEGGHAWSSHTDLITFGLPRCRHNIWCKISIGRGWQSRWIFLICSWGFAPFELFNISHCIGEADMRQGTSFKSTCICVSRFLSQIYALISILSNTIGYPGIWFCFAFFNRQPWNQQGRE